MKHHSMLAVLAAAAHCLAAGPLASRAEAAHADMVNLSAIRHQTGGAFGRYVRVEGALRCDAGAVNTGAACDLSIRESRTGRDFALVEAGAAMRLYQDGNRDVAIEGMLADSETIHVKKAETL